MDTQPVERPDVEGHYSSFRLKVVCVSPRARDRALLTLQALQEAYRNRPELNGVFQVVDISYDGRDEDRTLYAPEFGFDVDVPLSTPQEDVQWKSGQYDGVIAMGAMSDAQAADLLELLGTGLPYAISGTPGFNIGFSPLAAERTRWLQCNGGLVEDASRSCLLNPQQQENYFSFLPPIARKMSMQSRVCFPFTMAGNVSDGAGPYGRMFTDEAGSPTTRPMMWFARLAQAYSSALPAQSAGEVLQQLADACISADASVADGQHLSSALQICKTFISSAVCEQLREHCEKLYPLLLREDASVGARCSRLYDAKLVFSTLVRDLCQDRNSTHTHTDFGLAADGSTIVDLNLVNELVLTLMSLHLPPGQRFVSEDRARLHELVTALASNHKPNRLLFICDCGVDPNEDDIAAILVQLNVHLLATGALVLEAQPEACLPGMLSSGTQSPGTQSPPDSALSERQDGNIHLAHGAEPTSNIWQRVEGLEEKQRTVAESVRQFEIGEPVKLKCETLSHEASIASRIQPAEGSFAGGIWRVKTQDPTGCTTWREVTHDMMEAYPSFPKLGVSLEFLEHIATHPLVQSNPDFTSADVCLKFVQPITRNAKCSLAEALSRVGGCEPVSQRPFAGVANIFVCHAWRYNFKVLLATLKNFAATLARPEELYFWYDVVSVNQHVGLSLPQQWWSFSFRRGIGEIRHTLLVLSPWRDPTPLRRAWCLWEILCTHLEGAALTLVMPPDDEAELKSLLKTAEGMQTIDRKLDALTLENVEAYLDADLDMIKRCVSATASFAQVNELILSKMRSWLLDCCMATTREPGVEVEHVAAMNVARMLRRAGRWEDARQVLLSILPQPLNCVGAATTDTLEQLVVLYSHWPGGPYLAEAEESAVVLIRERRNALTVGLLASILQKRCKYEDAHTRSLEAFHLTVAELNCSGSQMPDEDARSLYISAGRVLDTSRHLKRFVDAQTVLVHPAIRHALGIASVQEIRDRNLLNLTAKAQLLLYEEALTAHDASKEFSLLLNLGTIVDKLSEVVGPNHKDTIQYQDVIKQTRLSGCALCVALGGSSDVVGVLALARAVGFTQCVLVQPGSPQAVHQGMAHVTEQAVAPKGPPAPGGAFYDNESMVAYLLSLPDYGALAGYYLVQPKTPLTSSGHGFTTKTVGDTATVLTKLCRKHNCVAVLGLDFGGDVVLNDDPREEGFVKQRDRVNLIAASEAAGQLGLPTMLVVAGTGVDASAYAPEYLVQRDTVVSHAFFEMREDGLLHKVDGIPPLPPSYMLHLPTRLFLDRFKWLECEFLTVLRKLADQILLDCPDELRREHFNKTYLLVARIAATVADVGKDIFAVGHFRGSERARAHVFSRTACALYGVAAFAT